MENSTMLCTTIPMLHGKGIAATCDIEPRFNAVLDDHHIRAGRGWSIGSSWF